MTSDPRNLSPLEDGLDLARAKVAHHVIPSVLRDTPQFEDPLLSTALGRPVTVKIETLNPLRCFKGRGVSFALRDVAPGEQVVCASSGNFGQAVAWVGASRGAEVRVFVPAGANPAKTARMTAFGAEVVPVDGGLREARRAADAASTHGGRLIIDGVDPGVAEGAATIAEEITRSSDFDVLVAPIGDGSLITGLALWIRAHSPRTRIVGVSPASATSMFESWKTGRVVRVDPTTTFAEGLAIPQPHPVALRRVSRLVDDVVLVTDDDLRRGMDLIARHLSIMAEPAGAAGVAAIATGAIPDGSVATLVTGANPRTPDTRAHR